MRALRIKDAEGQGDYDLFVHIPDELTLQAGIDIVDAAIVKAKADNPDDYTAEDLFSILADHGVNPVNFDTVNESW